ncbi:MAG TPA: PadR family transcriptional regulator [Gaiellaceae bacterium]|nr:PadR family transcriptional regulator [Gaiellaceae bacterium]
MHRREGNFMFGPGPGPFGGGGFGGPQMMRMHRSRRRGRGDVRSAILLLLAEEPRNGYQIMQELEQRSGGIWRPSPGSVYPALQLLADEGLVTSEARGGGNVFELTDAGRAHLAEKDESAEPPWEAINAGATEEMIELRRVLMQTADAVKQVVRSGNDSQRAAAVKLLEDTRRGLYGILAGE